MAGRPYWDANRKTIRYAPKARECYWFNIPSSRAPEIPSWHPCVILKGAPSTDERRHAVMVVPLTSKEPREWRPGVVKLSRNPNPCDDRDVWALCEFVSTIGLFRLERFENFEGKRVTPKVSTGDIGRILDGVLEGTALMRRHVEQKVREAEERVRAEYAASQIKPAALRVSEEAEELSRIQGFGP